MDTNALLLDLFGRASEHVEEVLDGLEPDGLHTLPAGATNPIGWLIWHLTRVEDAHIAELLDEEQVWTAGGWAAKFGLEPDPHNSGYGHSAADVAAVRPDSVATVRDYYVTVAERTRAYLSSLTNADLDQIVDRNWDPPVTLGVRLVSIVDDEIQHAGQASYLRGLLHD